MRRLASVPLAATTVFADDFHRQVDGLTPAYNEIVRWIEANGYGIAGPPREIFYGSPDNGDLTAEVQFPVEKMEA